MPGAPRRLVIFVVPTLSVRVPAEHSDVAELVRETDEAVLSAIQRQTLAARFPGGLAKGGDVPMENVRRLRAAGVRLVAGTDSPNPGNRNGNLHARGAAPARAPAWEAQRRWRRRLRWRRTRSASRSAARSPKVISPT